MNKKPEVYLKPNRTSTTELFCKNSYGLKAVKCLRSIVYVRLGSKYASGKRMVKERIIKNAQ